MAFMKQLRYGLLFAIPLLLLANEVIVALKIVRSTSQQITDPSAFVQEFDPASNQPITSRGPLFISFAGLFWPTSDSPTSYSPIIPYRPLQESWEQSASCRIKPNGQGGEIISGGARVIYSDPLWEVSWVFIETCYKDSQYFGPFRFAPAL